MQNPTSIRLSDEAMRLRAELAERHGISLNSITEMAIRSLARQDEDSVAALRILCAPESLNEIALFLLGPRFDYTNPVYERLNHLLVTLRDTGRLPETAAHSLVGQQSTRLKRSLNLAIKA